MNLQNLFLIEGNLQLLRNRKRDLIPEHFLMIPSDPTPNRVDSKSHYYLLQTYPCISISVSQSDNF